MSKKKLNIDTITNELEGASLFFANTPAKVEEKPQIPEFLPHPKIYKDPVKKNENKIESKHASMQASTHAINEDEIIETIRKTVKQVGKETVFLRLTTEEKRELASVVYSLNEMYSGEISKTTENQLGRIGLNYLLEDYKDRGELSILAKVIKALNA